MKVRSILSGGKVHLDVVQGFTLAQIVIIGCSEQTSSMTPHDRFQVAAMNVECKRFKSVHLREDHRDLIRIELEEIERGKGPGTRSRLRSRDNFNLQVTRQRREDDDETCEKSIKL